MGIAPIACRVYSRTNACAPASRLASIYTWPGLVIYNLFKLQIVPTENRYHDHNNLSTKNKINLTDMTRKKDYNKKSAYTERPIEVLREMCMQVSDDMRFDCHPQNDASEEECAKRGWPFRLPYFSRFLLYFNNRNCRGAVARHLSVNAMVVGSVTIRENDIKFRHSTGNVL